MKPVLTQEEVRADSTDLALFVRTSGDNIVGWNRKKIVDALVRETEISRDIAEIIGHEVERQIAALRINHITAPLIRAA